MSKFKKMLLLLMPLMIFVSENAVAGGWGWHQRLQDWASNLPEWLQVFIINLHAFFLC